MSKPRKVIITCAVTGSIHTPSMSPHLPVTPDEIAEAAIGAAEAGASIIHLHARDPSDGRPTQDPDVFLRFLPRIKQATEAVVNITTGGGPTMTVDERMRPAAELKPEVASLNMGSMNFALFPMLARFQDFAHDWERAHLENSRDLVFRNTFQDIEKILGACRENATRFEFERHEMSFKHSLTSVISTLGVIRTERDILVRLVPIRERRDIGRDFLFADVADHDAGISLQHGLVVHPPFVVGVGFRAFHPDVGALDQF
jgi:uncharacterized protein (DUF849 family)